MASNPPFNAMEDQTDEDFFDKLVDDDFGPSFNSDPSSKIVAEGSDSDDAKAFSNLSIEDTSGGGEGGLEQKGGSNLVNGGALGLSGSIEEDSKRLDSVATSVSHSTGPLNDDAIGSNVISDPVVSESSGATKPGIKQVDWNSFYADSLPNGNHGFDSYSHFFNDLGDKSEGFPTPINGKSNTENTENFLTKDGENSFANNGVHIGSNDSDGHYEYQDGTQVYGGSAEVCQNGQDMNSSQYWENMYPGWIYDENTGQWYQVDAYDAMASAQGFDANAGMVSDGQTGMNYLQQNSVSTFGTVVETSTTESMSQWNQLSQLNTNGYPEHMIFDPQYPGWYYDTNVQQWLSLESYNSYVQPAALESNEPQNQNASAFQDTYWHNSSIVNGEYGQGANYAPETCTSQGQHERLGDSYGYYNQQGSTDWQPDTYALTNSGQGFGGNQQLQNAQVPNFSMSNHVASRDFSETVPSYDTMNQGHGMANGFPRTQSLVPTTSFSQQFDQKLVKKNDQMNYANDYYESQKAALVSQQSFQSDQPFSYAPSMGMSNAGCPPHSLVTFGFGGKLIVMKNGGSIGSSSVETQGSAGGSISILNMMDVVSGGNDNSSSVERGPSIYFHALCQQAFPGPLVGGNVGNKELNKWIDERITKCGSADLDSKKGETLRLLLSLLKIACQHYGKLRSPFGTDNSLTEGDAPEIAVARLFASASKNFKQVSEYGVPSHCLQSVPSEGQLRATASEVQKLLVSGRKMEALQCAQEGQLWGPALVLASQLGDQFYVDTVEHMALHQLVPGSPLRTLSLLIAGKPAEVFSTVSMTSGGLPNVSSMSQQPGQFGADHMLDDWEENLAVITANRTKDDELVIIHLGDCMWKDRSEITAAHICYLIAEANFEAYSDSSRLCLIGTDHWKHPRTYASPEAIQRTELYEYSKVLGNSQFLLLPFQPYKLIYAYMLAEVGKISESLKYCQAVLKSLKTGRAPEVESWKQLASSLEERIRTHQQGGYAANLAPAKLVGKLFNFIDSTAHRVVGGLPPPAPSSTQGRALGDQQIMASRVSTSQSTMAMSSLTPSASMEPISEWAADGNRMTMHNRSISEPDFGRTPRQVDQSMEGTPSGQQGKASSSTVPSRFGRFGFGSQLLQKTVGLVLRPRSDKQAKLGEKNKFYYDEKLKQWVEEGAEPQAAEAALPPPPTTTAFPNGMPEYNLKSALSKDASPTDRSPKSKSSPPSEQTSGMPPIPTSSNQFSARGRMGVRARYVDTFNQGSGASLTKSFQSPSTASIKPVAANAKFFVPTPTPSSENLMEPMAENMTTEIPSSTMVSNSFESPSPSFSSATSMQRHPSTDNIANGVVPASSRSRRTASWSGSNFPEPFSTPRTTDDKPRQLGEVLGTCPVPFTPDGSSMSDGPSKDDELQEVEL